MINGKLDREVRCFSICFFFLLLIFYFLPISTFALDLTVDGGFGFTVDHTDVPLGAGGTPTPTHYSSVDVVSLDIGGSGGGSDAWQVQVRLEDTLWHGDLSLKVLRTGSGTGTVSGGDVLPIELTLTDQVFFEGLGDNTGINVQLILDGVSILIPADTYSGVIHFTLIDIP